MDENSCFNQKMKPKQNIVLILNGQGGSGKGVFSKAIQDRYKNVYKLSIIDNIKSIANIIGCDINLKDNKNRKLLSDLEDLTTEYNDYPFKSMLKEINNICYNNMCVSDGAVFIVDVRKPFQIKKFVNHFGPDVCKTVLIDRPDLEKFDNLGDNSVYDYQYNYYIQNNGSKQQLEQMALSTMQEILNKNL